MLRRGPVLRRAVTRGSVSQLIVTAPRSNQGLGLPVASWQPTRDTFTLCHQIIGKVHISRGPRLRMLRISVADEAEHRD